MQLKAGTVITVVSKIKYMFFRLIVVLKIKYTFFRLLNTRFKKLNICLGMNISKWGMMREVNEVLQGCQNVLLQYENVRANCTIKFV